MLAKLLTTLCLVALTVCIDDLQYPILRTMGIYPSEHVTVSARVQSPDLYLFNGPYYYIPSGQCNGLIDTSYLCGDEDVKGVEVRVADPSDFAKVSIYKRAGMVDIQRRGIDNNMYCPGMALVDLRLTCDHWQFSYSRNRARLPSLLDSESSESSDSDSSESNEEDNAEDENVAASV